MAVRLLMLLMAALAFSFAVPQDGDERTIDVTQSLDGAPAAPGAKLDMTAVADAIQAATNDFRAQDRLSELQRNDALRQTAADFAQYLAEHDVLGHTADGRAPAERAEAHGYDYCIVLENLAYVYNASGNTRDALVDELVEGWKNSPEHRANMLDADVTETGVAVARSASTGTYYGVQLFGRPRSAQQDVSIANESEVTVKYHLGDRSLTLGPQYVRRHTLCRPTTITFSFDATRSYPSDDGARFTVRGRGQTLMVDVAHRP